MKTGKKKQLKLTATTKDSRLIHDIAVRASTLAQKHGIVYDLLDADMDILACHANGCPLRLEELFSADDGNFGHDVFGIRRHIDRETGKLGGFFSPRYSRKDVKINIRFTEEEVEALYKDLQPREVISGPLFRAYRKINDALNPYTNGKMDGRKRATQKEE